MKKISIVVPCYNEERSLPLFYSKILQVTKKLQSEFQVDFELVFIDDGSKDNTLHEIKEINSKDRRVKYLSFSRNFGKESAIYAGLKHSNGDYICLIDADLQHPPKLIREMYLKIVNEGYDCVATFRTSRKGDPRIRSFFSRLFYKIMNIFSDIKMKEGAQDFRLMTRAVVDSILDMGEKNRFSKGIFSWVGFNTYWIECENYERIAGSTKWSFWSLFRYSLEGIFSFSITPLVISSIIGILMCIGSLLFLIFVVIKTIFYGDPVDGYPTLISVIY